MSIISTAYAATTQAPPTQNNLGSLLLLLGFFAIFYFLLWRPQAKRTKEQKNLLNSLAKGDEVVTAGGLMGQIAQLKDDTIWLKLTDNIEIPLQKSAVTAVLPKGTLKSL